MEEKYYTPKIEEFHVGFEYEGHRSMFCKKHEYMWIPLMFGRWTSPKNNFRLKEVLAKECIRVKYLDRGDVESLGWIHYETIGTNELFKKGGSELILTSSAYIEMYFSFDYDIQFNGYCKNKSEFKKIMKQLNIK